MDSSRIPDLPRSRIKVSNPYAQRFFLKRILFNKRLFGSTVDHAILRLLGDTYVKFLQREHNALFSWVEIETINRCNSMCSFCPVNKKDDTRDFAYMSTELFTKIIDELSLLGFSGRLAPYSNNEPLLDKDIVDRVGYAKMKCPDAQVYILTNGMLLKTELAWQLLEAGIDFIKIDNYSDNFKLHSNIKKLVEDFEHPPYAQHAHKIHVVMRRMTEVLSNRGGAAPNKAPNEDSTYRYYQNASCGFPFTQLVIRPDGKVSLCCNDALGQVTVGDASRESLERIWYGAEFRKLRKELTNNGRKNLPICKRCDVYAHEADVFLKHSKLLRFANSVFHFRKPHWK